MTAADYARGFVGRRETHGKNRSPWIDWLNGWIAKPLGSPYCATGVSYCLQLAGAGTATPITASSQAFKRWAKRAERLFDDPQDLELCTGALFGWTEPNDPAHGHIGFVVGRRTAWFGLSKRVVAIDTIEFNTGADGGRDGDGVWVRRRKVPLRGKHGWFIDLTGIKGCKWLPVRL